VGGIRGTYDMRAAVPKFHRCDGRWGEVSEIVGAPDPACRAECFPNPKCSQPKCAPAAGNGNEALRA
jgi:hypothetical protein